MRQIGRDDERVIVAGVGIAPQRALIFIVVTPRQLELDAIVSGRVESHCLSGRGRNDGECRGRYGR